MENDEKPTVELEANSSEESQRPAIRQATLDALGPAFIEDVGRYYMREHAALGGAAVDAFEVMPVPHGQL